MSIVLNPDQISDLRQTRLEAHLSGILVQFDEDRFRKLGPDHARAFVRCAIVTGDGHAFEFLEEYEYLLRIMSVLGTHFLEDPRYAPIARVLARDDRPSSHRVHASHKLIRRVSDRFIGPQFSLARPALHRFHQTIEATGADSLTDHAVLQAFAQAYLLTDAEQAWLVPEQSGHAARMAAFALDIDTEHGRAVCLALALWLGSGFWRDPLYPWVAAIPAGTAGGASEKAEALAAYATRRMQKTFG